MRLALLFVGLALVGLLAVACGGGGTEYQVTVGFNESVTQADMDEVDAFLRAFDENMDFLVQETFPPTGVARLTTDEPDFCARVESELGAKPYISEVTCREYDEPAPSGSPDGPLSSTPLATSSAS